MLRTVLRRSGEILEQKIEVETLCILLSALSTLRVKPSLPVLRNALWQAKRLSSDLNLANLNQILTFVAASGNDARFNPVAQDRLEKLFLATAHLLRPATETDATCTETETPTPPPDTPTPPSAFPEEIRLLLRSSRRIGYLPPSTLATIHALLPELTPQYSPHQASCVLTSLLRLGPSHPPSSALRPSPLTALAQAIASRCGSGGRGSGSGSGSRGNGSGSRSSGSGSGSGGSGSGGSGSGGSGSGGSGGGGSPWVTRAMVAECATSWARAPAACVGLTPLVLDWVTQELRKGLEEGGGTTVGRSGTEMNKGSSGGGDEERGEREGVGWRGDSSSLSGDGGDVENDQSDFLNTSPDISLPEETMNGEVMFAEEENSNSRSVSSSSPRIRNSVPPRYLPQKMCLDWSPNELIQVLSGALSQGAPACFIFPLLEVLEHHTVAPLSCDMGTLLRRTDSYRSAAAKAPHLNWYSEIEDTLRPLVKEQSWEDPVLYPQTNAKAKTNANTNAGASEKTVAGVVHADLVDLIRVRILELFSAVVTEEANAIVDKGVLPSLSRKQPTYINLMVSGLGDAFAYLERRRHLLGLPWRQEQGGCLENAEGGSRAYHRAGHYPNTRAWLRAFLDHLSPEHLREGTLFDMAHMYSSGSILGIMSPRDAGVMFESCVQASKTQPWTAQTLVLVLNSAMHTSQPRDRICALLREFSCSKEQEPREGIHKTSEQKTRENNTALHGEAELVKTKEEKMRKVPLSDLDSTQLCRVMKVLAWAKSKGGNVPPDLVVGNLRRLSDPETCASLDPAVLSLCLMNAGLLLVSPAELFPFVSRIYNDRALREKFQPPHIANCLFGMQRCRTWRGGDKIRALHAEASRLLLDRAVELTRFPNKIPQEEEKTNELGEFFTYGADAQRRDTSRQSEEWGGKERGSNRMMRHLHNQIGNLVPN